MRTKMVKTKPAHFQAKPAHFQAKPAHFSRREKARSLANSN